MCFLCVWFCSVWFNKQNIFWCVRCGSGRKVKHRFGRSLLQSSTAYTFLSCLFIKTWQLTLTQHHINVYSTANYTHCTIRFQQFSTSEVLVSRYFKLALNLGGLAKDHLMDLFCLTLATCVNSWGQTLVLSDLSELKSSTWRWSFHNWVTGLTFFSFSQDWLGM